MPAKAHRHRGARNHHAGKSAEIIVERHYQAAGQGIAARRWRGKGGEIDLVAEDGDAVIFIEVKSAACFAAAAARVSPAKIERLYAAGAEYLASCPRGQDTNARFDVALVDGMGLVSVLENATMM